MEKRKQIHQPKCVPVNEPGIPLRSLVLRAVRLGGCSHGDVSQHWDVMLCLCNMKNSPGSLALKGLLCWTLNWHVIAGSYQEEIPTGAEWKRDCGSQRSGQGEEWSCGTAWTRTQVTWTPVPIHWGKYSAHFTWLIQTGDIEAPNRHQWFASFSSKTLYSFIALFAL